MNLKKIFLLLPLIFTINACTTNKNTEQKSGITSVESYYDCSDLLNNDSIKHNDCTYEQVFLHLFNELNPKNSNIRLINIDTDLNNFIPLHIAETEKQCFEKNECYYKALVKGYSSFKLPDGSLIALPAQILQEYTYTNK